MTELDYFTMRNLELIEVALDSAIRAVGRSDAILREEYEAALMAVVALQGSADD